MRKVGAIVVLFLLLAAWSAVHAGQQPLAGNWKISFVDGSELLTFWLLKLETKDGKLTGTVQVKEKTLPETTLHDLTLKDGELKFDLKIQTTLFHFVCKVPKGEVKKLHGTMAFRKMTYAVQLEATKTDSLKDVEAQTTLPAAKGDFKELREQLAKNKDDITVFHTGNALIAAAVADKIALADLKQALAPLFAAAADYGSKWQQRIQLDFAQKLATSAAYAPYGEELARQGLKEAGATDVSLQIRLHTIIATSLEKQGKKDEAGKVQQQISALEVKDHEENEKAGLGFMPTKFEGRKGNKTVLVELFTGAQCPPCVAAEVAFEGLSKTYSTNEVVLLQYHLHIPGPDPMTTRSYFTSCPSCEPMRKTSTPVLGAAHADQATCM